MNCSNIIVADENIPDALCGFVLLRIPPLSPEYILKTLEWLIFESGIELNSINTV